MIKVRWNRPNIFSVGDVRFFPGLNEISEEVFREICKNHIVKAKLTSGLMVVDKTEVKKTAKSIAADMKDVYDVKRLREFLADERDVVSRAAKAQLDRIDKETAKENDNDQSNN
jgi:hypothetical protein